MDANDKDLEKEELILKRRRIAQRKYRLKNKEKCNESMKIYQRKHSKELYQKRKSYFKNYYLLKKQKQLLEKENKNNENI